MFWSSLLISPLLFCSYYFRWNSKRSVPKKITQTNPFYLKAFQPIRAAEKQEQILPESIFGYY